MNKIILVFLLKIAFIQCESITNFNLQNFYFEFKDKKYIANMINNPTSNEISNQLPLENTVNSKGDLVSIPLKSHINIDVTKSASVLVKGNILSDGNSLLIYCGLNQVSTPLGSFHIWNGNLNNIDEFRNSYYLNPSLYLSFKILCESSILMDEKVDLSITNPSFNLFNKDSLYFEEVPKLYFGNNNEPLYSYCEINKEMAYEINCKFSEEDIEKFYSLYPETLDAYEIIPGCSFKINIGVSLNFLFIKNCAEYSKNNNTCLKCQHNKKYRISKDGKECKLSYYFYYMIIGVPILDIVLIIFMILTLKKCQCECDLSTFLFFVLIGIFLIINILSILFFLLDDNNIK